MSAKILVVDDEVAIRSFITRVLEKEGYTVDAADNGRAALEKLQQNLYDVLLTDIKMDYMDGVGLLRKAKDLYPDLAVILFTGHATVQTAVEALRYGAYDYLLKPVKNEHIVQTVRLALEHREQEQRRDRLEAVAGQIMQAFQPDVASPQAHKPQDQIVIGDLVLHPASYQAFWGDESISLTPTEFRLLTALAVRPGHVFDYVSLVKDACGYQCPRNEARQIIGTHVINLRNKLKIEADQVGYVASVRGVGYRLIPPDEVKD